MKILLFGANGQVGWELQRALAPLGPVTALGREGAENLCGDLTQPEQIAATVRKVAPDVVVNAAAYTAVDRAESEPDTAHTINADAPAALATAANDIGAWLVHYSTDYVFDGSGQDPWTEDDPTAPLNAYGRTKLAGEQAIRDSGCRHLIFRTSWVFAARGKNFIRTMLRLARERDALQVIDDQHGAPTGAALVADVTVHAITSAVEEPERSGLYHLAADGKTTWHGYARYVIERARAAGWPVQVADEAIAQVPTEAFPAAAERPQNSRLDCSRLERTFGVRLPDWRNGVEHALQEILEGDGSREQG